MTIAVMQPYVFPYLGYYQLIKAVERFVIYDDVAFIKQGWINRNNLLVAQQKHLFSIPVSGGSSHRRICEIAVADEPRWATKLLRTIAQAYGHAPQFPSVYGLIESVLADARSIATLATRSLTAVWSFLDLSTEFVVASQRYDNQHLAGSQRVIDICRREGARRYVNAIGGRSLYYATDFAEHGIELRFLSSRLPEYPQFGGPFVPGLSMIDVLMFNAPGQVRAMLDQYELLQ
ncbi:MAG TPA: WbqC family protein [Candidatus Synoicihabitans sp.]|nr:WbqC family protein [Candidatus Synoicihabitans sp.]